MKGQTKRIIDKILDQESKGDEFQRLMAKSKLVMKGIFVDKFTEDTEDDPDTIAKLKEIAKEFNVSLNDLELEEK